ncbi:choline dehydrogenase [Nannizzia gypsea CBS 118893]|uniref:Choline dehydrogenase n=1 Tax=Arthroderma gypseum (strain ATCC MYA-4604 / CBS 118893) TaxID=535722 RepID=E4UP68_ARTGP|nr:choline dehydrogenase [Nannizzia gypsea CBS 118893]EFQ99794.1 choline dehydrogenase [Nannizzia gypsea CBS 118893]
MSSKIPVTIDAAKSRRYDAIIVGGGVAGLVAAARLSEDANKRILVIEAGEDRRGDPRIDTPGLFMGLWGDPAYDWGFWTEPQAHLNSRQIPQPRGKVLGGSSAINVAAIVYPSQRDFQAWTRLGNRGWSYEDMAPYYKKFHTFFPASKETNELLSLDSYLDPGLHGTDGPLQATFPNSYGPFNQAWMAAFNGAGFRDSSDPIVGKKIGPFTPPNSVDTQNRRSYSASAYCTGEVENRPNLDLLAETFVTKVLLQSSDSGVVEGQGIQVRGKDGSVSEIYTGEVILAAGALQSPLILENSGIGSRDILERYGIETVIDNPGVGENLQDHCFTSISFEVADDQVSADITRDPTIVKAWLQEYNTSRTGPLSGIPFSLAYMPPVDINGRMSSHDIKSLTEAHMDLKHPNLLPPGRKEQFTELRDMVLDPQESLCFYGLMPSQMNIELEGKTPIGLAYSQQRPENYISVMVGLNHPFSRGSVHVRSSDPLVSPAIDPGYLSHPLDVEILARGTQFIENIVSQQEMKRLLKDSRLPPLASNLADIEIAKQVTKERLWTTYHPSCTCAMMPRDLGGVVNDRLIVHGTKNVRVIDASVLPMITLGNIQATVYAVAERASDLIKEDWAGSS